MSTDGTKDYLAPGLWTDAQEIEDGWDVPMLVLGGAIKHWWGEQWDTPEHRDYIQWRNDLTQFCIDQKWLVYRPHEAFKGTWNPRAQVVNDTVIANSDLFVVCSEEHIPSGGTDAEIKFCQENNVPWIRVPPSYGLMLAAKVIQQALDNNEYYR